MKDAPSKITILSDFDGTIVPIDLSDFIYRRFTTRGLYFAELWEQGVINTRQEIQQAFETANAGREVIASALAGISIDPTFHDLANLSRQCQVELAVVSDGLDWAIQTVLAANGIYGLPVYANHVVFHQDRFSFEFPWYDPQTPHAGVSKPVIIKHYQQQGSRVLFIGDGRSDWDAVAVADIVFARGKLVDYCRAQNIAAFEFNNFKEICARVSGWLPAVCSSG